MNKPARSTYRQENGQTIPVYDAAVVQQPMGDYTEEDHALWTDMLRAQTAILHGRAMSHFLPRLTELGIDPDRIPSLEQVSDMLCRDANWKLVAVNGLLPERDFFGHLANRTFPVTWWIRDREQRHYIAEPDLFHDFFGHVPMLAAIQLGNFLEAYGKAAGALIDHPEALTRLARLYWYTIEFGLVMESGERRILGAGLLSSFTESIDSLESETVERRPFDIEACMARPYLIDRPQDTYFVLPNLEALLELDEATLVRKAQGA